MPRKKKNKSAATAKKQKGKTSRTKSSSARKPSPKKQEVEILPVLNAEKLKELYATMMKCRMLAQRMQSDHTENSSSNSVLGFEATLVGAGAHLLAKDSIAMEQQLCCQLDQGNAAAFHSCAKQRRPGRQRLRQGGFKN